MAELIDVEFERVAISRAYTYLIIISQMLVYLTDVVLLRETV
jgi:hypothetical protein